jgi:hypothetical protein
MIKKLRSIKKAKRIGALSLAVVMLIGILPLTALATEPSDPPYSAVLSNNNLTLTVTLTDDPMEDDIIRVYSTQEGATQIGSNHVIDNNADKVQVITLSSAATGDVWVTYQDVYGNGTESPRKKSSGFATDLQTVGANGTAGTATTTELTFTFSNPVKDLSATNIQITNTTASGRTVTPGVPSTSDDTVWTVPITGTWNNGDSITVASTLEGVTVLSAANPTTIHRLVPDAPPVVSTATIDGTAMVLTFDKALDETGPPAAAAFTVNYAGGTSETIDLVAFGSSTTLAITMAAAPAPSAAVTISYNPGNAGANPLKGAGVTGTDVAAFNNITVTNNTPIASALQSVIANGTPATVTSTQVTLTFTVAVPDLAVGDITFANNNNSERAITLGVPVTTDGGLTYTINITNATTGTWENADVLSISAITKSGYNISITSGNATLHRDIIPPTLAVANPAVIVGDKLTLTFNEPLDETPILDGNFFEVMIESSKSDIVKVEVKGDKVILELETAAKRGETVTVKYTKPTTPADNAIRDLAGNYTITFGDPTPVPVTNQTTEAIVFKGLTVLPESGTTTSLVFTFDEPIEGFALGDITLVNTTDARRVVTLNGSLTPVDLNGDTTYTIAVDASSIWMDGDVIKATLEKELFVITPDNMSVALNRVGTGTARTLTGITANGTSRVTDTTQLTLVFDNPVAALTATDIMIVNATTGASITVDSVTDETPSRWIVGVSGAWENGDELEIVAIIPASATITLSVNKVTVHRNSPPVIVSAEINNDLLTLIYDKNLDEAANTPTDAFTVTFDGESVTVDNVSISYNTVILTLDEEAYFTTKVLVSYAIPSTSTNRIRAYNAPFIDAAALVNYEADNKTLPPSYVIDYENETITLYPNNTGIWYNLLNDHITIPTRANLTNRTPNDTRGFLPPGSVPRTIRLHTALNASTASSVRTLNILWVEPVATATGIRAQLLDPVQGARISLSRPSGAGLGLNSFNVDYRTDGSNEPGIVFDALSTANPDLNGRKLEVANVAANFAAAAVANPPNSNVTNTTGRNNSLVPLYRQSNAINTGSVTVPIPMPNTASTNLLVRVKGCNNAGVFATSNVTIAVTNNINTWRGAIGAFINYRGDPITSSSEMFERVKSGSMPSNVTTEFRDQLIVTGSNVARWTVPNDGFTYQWRLQSEAADSADAGWVNIVPNALLPVDIFNPVRNTNLTINNANLPNITNPQFQIRRLGDSEFGTVNSLPSPNWRTAAHGNPVNIGNFNRAAGTLAAGANGREYLVLTPGTGITATDTVLTGRIIEPWTAVPGNAIPIDPNWPANAVIYVRAAGTASAPHSLLHNATTGVLHANSFRLLPELNIPVNVADFLVLNSGELEKLLQYNPANGRLTVNQDISMAFTAATGYVRASRLSVSANGSSWLNITNTTNISHIVGESPGGKLWVRFQGTSSVAPSAPFAIYITGSAISLTP